MSHKFRLHELDKLKEDYDTDREEKKRIRQLKKEKMIKRRKAKKAKRDLTEMMMQLGLGG